MRGLIGNWIPSGLASKHSWTNEKKLKDTRSDPTQFSLQTLVDWALCISLATSKLRLKRKEKKKVEDLLFFFFYIFSIPILSGTTQFDPKKKKKERKSSYP